MMVSITLLCFLTSLVREECALARSDGIFITTRIYLMLHEIFGVTVGSQGKEVVLEFVHQENYLQLPDELPENWLCNMKALE